MRIVIVGAGKMGYSLADYLTKEQHDIIVIENDENRREIIKSTLDVLTLEGNGANPAILGDPDIKNADVLIACTYSDEVNMVICMMAKKVGIKKTVARIRSTEYTGEASEFIRDFTNIDLILNPEKIIASEISQVVSTPFALDVEDFAEGEICMVETKIKENSLYINTPLHSLNMPENLLITGILRKNNLIIPRGNDMLLPNDNVFFIGLKDTIEKIEENLDTKVPKIKRALIIGAGRIARYLVPILEKQDISIKVIDKNLSRCEEMANVSKNVMIIYGDGTNIELLKQEGVEEADVVICLTEDDKLNLLLALLAKHLGTPKTIVKTALTEYVELMEEVGADTVVSTRLLNVQEVLRFVRTGGGVLRVSLFEGAKAEIIEIIIKENNPLVGIPLKNVDITSNYLICAVIHEGKAIIPNGNTVLYAGDRAIIFVEFGAVNDILAYFQER